MKDLELCIWNIVKRSIRETAGFTPRPSHRSADSPFAQVAAPADNSKPAMRDALGNSGV